MKKTHIIGLIVIAAGFAIILGLVSASSRYSDFSHATAHEGKTYHVIGQFIRDKGIEFNPYADANTFSFWMEDKDGTERQVIVRGDKPQDFELSEQIVVVGKMKGDVFQASEMQMKCPSKYVEEEVSARQ